MTDQFLGFQLQMEYTLLKSVVTADELQKSNLDVRKNDMQ